MKAVGDEKTCSTCRDVLALDAFHKNRRGADGLHNSCKRCVSEQNRRWRAANPEKKKAQNTRRNPERDYYRYAITKYGLTAEGHEALIAHQNGLCAICASPPTNGRRLSIDHDHETGAVRGLLCQPCNLALGYFRDNKIFLANAIAYLGE